MAATIFREQFDGMRVRVLQQRGNPCPQPELQRHFHLGYKLIVFTATPGNPNMRAGHWPFKFVAVKPTWNVEMHKLCKDKRFAIIDQSEIILTAQYRVTTFNEQDVEEVAFILHSLSDGIKRRLPVFIPHKAVPKFPIQT